MTMPAHSETGRPPLWAVGKFSALLSDGKWAKVALAVIVLALIGVNAIVIRATGLEHGTLGLGARP